MKRINKKKLKEELQRMKKIEEARVDDFIKSTSPDDLGHVKKEINKMEQKPLFPNAGRLIKDEMVES